MRADLRGEEVLGISGGCFTVRLIHELDVFSVFEPFFGVSFNASASYTRKSTANTSDSDAKKWHHEYIIPYVQTVIHRRHTCVACDQNGFACGSDSCSCSSKLHHKVYKQYDQMVPCYGHCEYGS